MNTRTGKRTTRTKPKKSAIKKITLETAGTPEDEVGFHGNFSDNETVEFEDDDEVEEVVTEETKSIEERNYASDDAIAEAKRESREEVRRKTRIPVGKRSVLNFPQRPGYVRRVVNDTNDGERVKMFIEAGWVPVQMPNIDGGDKRAGADSQLATAVVRSVGGGTKGILMEIKKEWYDEDQAAKMKEIDRKEATLKRKKTSAANADADGNYGEVDIGFK